MFFLTMRRGVEALRTFLISGSPRRDLAQTCIRWRDLLELDLEAKGPVVVLPPLIRRRESQFAALAAGVDHFGGW